MKANEPGRRTSHLSQEETDALNKHGVFFKKRILQALNEIRDVGIVAEEIGVSFGETRVIDIVAQDKRYNPELLFVFGCKACICGRSQVDFLPRFRPAIPHVADAGRTDSEFQCFCQLVSKSSGSLLRRLRVQEKRFQS